MAEPPRASTFELAAPGSTPPSQTATTCLDVALALSAVCLLPLCCRKLLESCGAALPLLLYYGLYCVLIVRWRRGTFGYSPPWNLVPWRFPPNSLQRCRSYKLVAAFCVLLAVQACAQVASFETIQVDQDASWTQAGFLCTLLVWAPANSMLEQLSWLYCFDAFDKYGLSEVPFSMGRRLAQSTLGLLACLALVGSIHVFFWTKFLPDYVRVEPQHTVLFTSRFVVTPGYILVREWSQSMTPVAMVHILSDVCLVLGSRYDLLPRLFRPLP
ncbi:unnamed protein product [Symbiodinium natans]|uniref:CAAX prenyl protease 2 n=1 Tax=Symbiodinium natans TaxID=878477 RepID=A0A812KFF5_9DINO|nr:unnamed protein product [Symbiodinium natans]